MERVTLARVLHVIVNPVAGRGLTLRALPGLRALLDARGIEHRLLLTAAPGDATRLARALPGIEPVAAVGGDGTLHEVLQAVSGAQRPVGVIPLGSGDDFARAIGLKPLDYAAAVAVIERGRTRRLDVAVVDGQPCACGFGAGLDAQVTTEALHAPRFLKGPGRYAWGIFKAIAGQRQSWARVTADGQVVHDGPTLLVAAMNTRSYGGGLRIAPQADPGDGLLDLVIGGQFNRAGTLAILPRLVAGAHLTHPQVRLLRAREVRVQWREPTPGQADGEMLPLAIDYRVSIQPQAFSVYAP